MNPMHPKTYNEVLLYKRCLTVKTITPGMDEAMFQKLYAFMSESSNHNVQIADGTISFYNGTEIVDGLQLNQVTAYTSLLLTRSNLSIQRPVSTGSGSDDSGSSGNNNNNNNNNNNA